MAYPHASGVLTNDGSGTLSWTAAGDITGITAGEGISGGGTTGDVTVSLNVTQIDVSNCTSGTGAGKIYWDTVSNRFACGTDQTGTAGVSSLSQGTGITLSPNPITATGTISADTAYLQRRVSGTCAAGSSIRVINSDGTVSCETDDSTSLPSSGTSGQTLRHDGTNWVANSIIFNDGTNVGIGTASLDSNYKITTSAGGIKAASTTQPAGYFNSTSGYGLLVNTGNVGLGNLTPAYKLDITGDVRWSGTLQGGSVPWARLTSFPTACSAGQYVSAVGSTLTCSTPSTSGYATIQDEGVARTQRNTVNFIGTGISCVDNGTSLRTDCTITAGSGTVTSIGQGTGLTFSANPITTTGTISADTAYLQRRVSGTCAAGSSIRIINSDGTVTCETDDNTALPSGTSGQTLRHNGTAWVANSVFYNNGTNVGIGTSAPGDQLEIYDGSATNNSIRMSGNRPILRWNELDSTDSNYQIDIAAGQLRFQTNNDAFTSATARMVMDQSGKVGIGTTAPTYQLQLSTDSAAKPGSNTWTVASDIRLKTNIQPYTKGLKEILQINPISYQYNGSGGIGHSKVCTGDPCVEQDVVDTELLSKTFVGVIAQDIQAVVPETVTSHKGKINEDDKDETDILDFDSHSLTFILINAVKELSAKIESLNQQVADLKTRVK